GVGRQGGFLDDQGRLAGSERAFFSDAVGTTAGALLGTSPVTSYIESAAGVEEGGRTGLTAIVVGLLFLVALVFLPVIVAVPAAATAPALIVVGAMMMEGARSIDWKRIEYAVPSFLTIVGMPFTYSIADGISLGIVSYTFISVLIGKYKNVSPVMYVLTALLIAYFGFASH
ncbi:MAG: NCS2 family permease, partial [Pseudomonadota bacterium]